MDNKKYSDLVNSENYPSDLKVPLDPSFTDVRGTIQNLINVKIGSVAVITSKAGTSRSNHWHQYNWHYLYVVSGSMKYLERDLGGSNLTEIIVKAGEMVFTAPHKEHRTEFLEDTVLISLGKDSKDHDNHEEDITRVEW